MVVYGIGVMLLSEYKAAGVTAGFGHVCIGEFG